MKLSKAIWIIVIVLYILTLTACSQQILSPAPNIQQVPKDWVKITKDKPLFSDKIIETDKEQFIIKSDKLMEIEDKNGERLFSIESSVPMYFIGDIAKTKEWGYLKEDTVTVRSVYNLSLEGNKIRIENPIKKGKLIHEKTIKEHYINSYVWKIPKIEHTYIEYPAQRVKTGKVICLDKDLCYNETIDVLEFNKISDTEMTVKHQDMYDPTVTTGVSSTLCSDYTCDEVLIVGDSLMLDGNESMLFWMVAHENDVKDLGKHHISLTETNSPTYEKVDIGDGSAWCVRMNDANNRWVQGTIPSGFNLTAADEWTFGAMVNHSEGPDNGFVMFDMINGAITHGLLVSEYDDSGAMRVYMGAGSSSSDDSGSDNLLSRAEGEYGGWGMNAKDELNPDGEYYVANGNKTTEDNLESVDFVTGETIYIGNLAGNFESEQCFNFVWLYDGYLPESEWYEVMWSKHGGFFEHKGNISLNFTGSGDTVNVSMNTEDNDAQTDVCFWIEEESSPKWRCSNTNSISLSSSVSEVNIDFMLNTSNNTKSPILKNVTIDIFSVASPEPSANVISSAVSSIMKNLEEWY